MQAAPPSKKSRARPGALDERSVPIDELAELRHAVLNNYQAVIACIFNEGVRTTSQEVKEALERVADCVDELASSLRRAEPDPGEPAAPSFNFVAPKT